MFQIIRSNQRGSADHGWLKSFHTFSFADYYNENMMGFRSLRVINEDWILANAGFPTHGHKDMEILTYVVEGALEHKDSMGNSTVIKPGEIQRMSAGTGIKHSEFNHYSDKTTHLLQIWILPKTKNIIPSYEQKDFSVTLKNNPIVLIASENGTNNSISLNQDVNLYACKQNQPGNFNFTLTKNRNYWIQLINGNLNLNFDSNKESLNPGDATLFKLSTEIKFYWEISVEFLIFDLA